MSLPKRVPVLIVAVLILVLLVLIASGLGRRAGASSDADVGHESGVEYIKNLEEKSPDAVEAQLKELRRQKLLKMREEYLQKLESGDLSVWTLFEDYVLLGDSRAVGFEYYEFLDSNRVMAEAGATILKLEEHIPDIAAYNPSSIFLCYGLNDVSIGIWPTPEEYVTQFRDILGQLQAELPDAKVYISSILPARDPAFNTSSAWYDIPEYSAAVEQMCSQIDGCYFIDNDEICQLYADQWEIDGIHIRTPFYPHWATNMIMTVYDSEVASEEATES